MILLGAAVNGAAIAAGGFVGLFAGRFLPDRLQKTLMCALALVVIGIAVPGIDDSQKPLVPILSMVLGTLLGELLDLDSAVIRLGDWLQRKTGGRGRFTDGFVNGTMVFAVGAMAIMGALNSGLQGDHTILFSKSVIGRHLCPDLCLYLGCGCTLLRRAGIFVGRAHRPFGFPARAPAGHGCHCGDQLHRLPAPFGHQPEYAGPYQDPLDEPVPAMLFPILLCRFL